MNLQVDISDEMKEKVRKYCFENRLSQKKVITEALTLYFKMKEKEGLCPKKS